MAEKSGRHCARDLIKCGSYHLLDLELPPWSPPPSKKEYEERLPRKLQNQIDKCLNCPRPKFKRPPLSSSFVPNFAPVEIGSYFSMGETTLKVPMTLFAENRSRLCRKLRENPSLPKGAVVLLQGGEPQNLYSTDVEYVFRQEPYFHWTFGAREPGFYGAIVVETGESTLFVPRLPESYATWSGPLKSLCAFKQIYETDQVNYVDQIKFVLRKLNDNLGSLTVLTLLGLNTDSGLMTKEATFEGINESVVLSALRSGFLSPLSSWQIISLCLPQCILWPLMLRNRAS